MKKSEQLHDYITKVQKIDTVFSSIKSQTSNDHVSEIVDTLKRLQDKHNEMSKKQFSIDNEIDHNKIKIEAYRQEMIDTMALVAKINEDSKLSAVAKLTQDVAIKRTVKE